MKKLLLVLTNIFALLTFVGAGYVLINKGTVNAGYGAVPMLFSLICLQGYRTISNKDKDKN